MANDDARLDQTKHAGQEPRKPSISFEQELDEVAASLAAEKASGASRSGPLTGFTEEELEAALAAEKAGSARNGPLTGFTDEELEAALAATPSLRPEPQNGRLPTTNLTSAARNIAKHNDAQAWQDAKVGTGLTGSVAAGAAKGVIETKDFVSGLFGNDEPRWEDKWSVRQRIERKASDLKKEGTVNGIAQSLSQFGVGFVGLGKVKWVAQGLGKAKEAGVAAGLAAETARGAAAGAIAMDPHEDRLSNFVEAFPALSNPVTTYLAAKPTDSAAEGRLKNALEGIVTDAVLVGAFAAVTKSIKLLRAGDINGANAAAQEADTLFAKANTEVSAEGALRASETNDRIPALSGDRVNGQAEGNAPRGDDTDLLAGSRDDVPAGGHTGASGGPVIDANAGRSGINGPTSGNVGDGQTVRLAPDVGRGDGTSAVGGAGNNLRPDLGSTNVQRVEFTDEEIALALSRVRQDQEALLTHGSREAAEDADYVFQGSDAAGIIPYQKLNTTEETQAWLGQLVERQTTFINRMRGGDTNGVLSDKAVDAIVAARAQAWRDDPVKLRGIINQAGDEAPNIVANLETSFLIANRAYQDAYELAKRIESNNFTGFTGRSEALAALQHRMATATALYATGKSIITNSARAMRRMRGEFRISDEQLASLRTSDPEEMLGLVVSTKGNVQSLTKLSQQTLAHRIVDGLSGYQAANLLWGWKTQVVNVASSAAMLVWRPLEVVTGSFGMQGKALLQGNDEAYAAAAMRRSQAVREVTYLATTLNDGWHAGVEAFSGATAASSPSTLKPSR